MRLKKASQTFAKIGLILLISLGLTEIVFRVYNYLHPSFIFHDSSYNRFRGKPLAPEYNFRLNSQGFKDVEFQVEKAPNTFRILGIGDSFAYGVVPYNYNYYTRLEEKLKQRDDRVEIINMGIPNLSPKDYLALLVTEGLALNPDRVILSFFIGNDFDDSKRSIESYSYVFSFWKFLIDLQNSYEGKVIHGNLEYQDDLPTLTDEKYLQIEIGRSDLFRVENSELESRVRGAMTYLREIKELCDRQNIELLVILIPDELQVNPNLQAKVIDELGMNLEDLDFSLPNQYLQEELTESEIDFLDLFPYFQGYSEFEQLYKPNDSHWNIAGNELAAELIFQYLQRTPEKLD
ncbi:MAG: SGNH/GDSL hydrolase family protein [Roseofilum sp. SBFL]|uniref:SGNH/GDSL hydrolase family protein n=1 Tax=unclassified Roseofilum TaxID=2620099 RepID=UPI001B2F0AC2|nr:MULTISPECIES: SGNH/GDSL hydrolase family protein [unclassified Roseofilum]MBP0013467.1 SGNH/GDSL hydrolase family protein [Roseofilum sp. SID3]MBP0024664.1 SGNH/GDSL hydrolase family protein [Roseofilum sp. SID2]MBP0040244.1 SGNH/GDSL hydrolase family protein [Roseofilum sp. SID1]MBP0043074.1 SGNH/GDSL hydrolase family protein [Roseofilum sp. SBFL]